MQTKDNTGSQPLTLAEVRALKAMAGDVQEARDACAAGDLGTDETLRRLVERNRRWGILDGALDPSTVVRLCEAVEAMAGALGGLREPMAGEWASREEQMAAACWCPCGPERDDNGDLLHDPECAAARAALPPDSPGGGS